MMCPDTLPLGFEQPRVEARNIALGSQATLLRGFACSQASGSGYRYDAIDPESGRAWPAMPDVFSALASDAAAAAGFAGFVPDACLINQYRAGARLSLHQDRNERDFTAPIVSVSLGLPATFLWGGRRRADRPVHIPLLHGDVAVWGGVDRLAFHGISPLADGMHPMTGPVRFNLTFRRAR
jgi:DNA oxidative demethylase